VHTGELLKENFQILSMKADLNLFIFFSQKASYGLGDLEFIARVM